MLNLYLQTYLKVKNKDLAFVWGKDFIIFSRRGYRTSRLTGNRPLIRQNDDEET